MGKNRIQIYSGIVLLFVGTLSCTSRDTTLEIMLNPEQSVFWNQNIRYMIASVDGDPLVDSTSFDRQGNIVGYKGFGITKYVKYNAQRLPIEMQIIDDVSRKRKLDYKFSDERHVVQTWQNLDSTSSEQSQSKINDQQVYFELDDHLRVTTAIDSSAGQVIKYQYEGGFLSMKESFSLANGRKLFTWVYKRDSGGEVKSMIVREQETVLEEVDFYRGLPKSSVRNNVVKRYSYVYYQ